jgi:hypothetical protein
VNASSARGPLLWLLLAGPLPVACNEGGLAPASEPSETSSADLEQGSGAPGGSVRCTFAYRQSHEVMAGQTGKEPAFQFEERLLDVAADQDSSETLGQLTFSVGFHTSEQDSDTVSLRVAAGEGTVLSVLYQLGPSGLPQNQFVGGHGFTGLLYFTHPTQGGDYQAFCESVR